jgi:hypothetical protein
MGSTASRQANTPWLCQHLYLLTWNVPYLLFLASGQKWSRIHHYIGLSEDAQLDVTLFNSRVQKEQLQTKMVFSTPQSCTMVYQLQAHCRWPGVIMQVVAVYPYYLFLCLPWIRPLRACVERPRCKSSRPVWIDGSEATRTSIRLTPESACF